MNPTIFERRHIGIDEESLKEMLRVVGVESLDELIDEVLPHSIRIKHTLNIPPAKSEREFIGHIKQLAKKNEVWRTYIGLGYYGTVTPNVILRNILENPGWYTAYTPYQAEIAQGRLEALMNYQTMISDLTGMQIANASLLDEATAAAEAMTMLYALRDNKKKNANTFLVSDACFPQTIDVLKTRALPLGINLVVKQIDEKDFSDMSVYGMILQNPDANGEIKDLTAIISRAHENGVLVCVASDLMSMVLIKPPGEMGADVVVGSSQRFGVPIGYGGPHAAFFATKDEYKRVIPGRIIGASVDAQGNPAYRMALQTREQHIRREKATSNICTSQVLLAVIAGAYAVYHGPRGIKFIAGEIHSKTCLLANALQKAGYAQLNPVFFDTLRIKANNTNTIKQKALKARINLRYKNDEIFISLDETTSFNDIQDLLDLFSENISITKSEETSCIPNELMRKSKFLSHKVFNSYHSEHEMLRYLKSLENKDLSLTHSMISLGSCTMKLNATTEMIPVTYEEFANIHPFAPTEQAQGYHQLFDELERWLCEITGFAAVSLQPNSGAQGEYAGLMVIKQYLESKGEYKRNVALIPQSAHGTNPASAVMAGMQVVVVKCDERGNIDMNDLREKAEAHKATLACLMVTYPSTHGVFEENIKDVCELIHNYGGQVYMDGANMNAQVGLTSPAEIGADVCHLNLHKTFCIPHGGGGPGAGPIAVASHLKKFLPSHVIIPVRDGIGGNAVSSAPWGSAGILLISYAYISMMGAEGLKNATKYAILNANYLKSRLEKYYPILYTGKNGRCAHEFILDCRAFKHSVNIEVEDIAKRLMDYGFHAPTVSFPVAGTLMIEPTESESKAELDRFCEAMIKIREEISEIENGHADKMNNVLKNAPHTASMVTSDTWDKPYSREKAAYPLPYLRRNKFWPSVSRVDNAYGDRNLVCTCLPLSEYDKSQEKVNINA
ncbi:MAG: aminomethyl-transferring glycine dehydrogenase [Cytophagaceae bacterium]|nr:aminomethyl-transferring glycine dehydrogenase [Cytophagaceae bacterium]MDW8455170.1 aminomethyl-transferring glycine dehydrogenase [Cytophagaceae bacterium]